MGNEKPCGNLVERKILIFEKNKRTEMNFLLKTFQVSHFQLFQRSGYYFSLGR